MKETNLTDEELSAFLHELGLYDKMRSESRAKEKEALLKPFKTHFPHKKNKTVKATQNSSLKISLFITLSLLLFTLVQTAFTLPLYMHMRKVQKTLEILLEETKKAPLPLPQELLPLYPQEEFIQPLIESEQALYKNA